jgi:aerobic C4-dicarboxylate transport protein
MALGIALGHFAPQIAVQAKPLADAFIRLIRLLVGPIIFVSIVHGVASLPSIKDAGRIGGKALLYFIGMSTASLVIGMIVANVLTPGLGLHADLSHLTPPPADAPHGPNPIQSLSGLFLFVIPDSIVEPFLSSNILQIVFLAIATAATLLALGKAGKDALDGIETFTKLLFTAMAFIMRLAPIAAFGAMAFTIGSFGLGALIPLGKLLLCFYLTCAVFIFGGLGLMLRSIGISLPSVLRFIKDEIAITFATSSSESALPRLLGKLEAMGCSKPVTSMVLPTGYSFNLDGTAIYLSLAALFLAQVTGTPMSLGDQLAMLGIMMLTSKGAAGVTGAGFITLSATLATMGNIPIAALTLILGIDRFMSEGRAVTNVIGNTVATLFVANWEGALDRKKLEKALKDRL